MDSLELNCRFDDQRNRWLEADDNGLLSLCRTENFQASGPGGQKRNRKYSAVRITHKSTNLSVTSSESRSYSENLKHALKKLRIKIAIEIRGPDISDEIWRAGRFRFSSAGGLGCPP